MISYAQNFEDVYLARAFHGLTSGFYIDIGAWDPVLDSVTKHFYDLGWRGINVEPIPQLHRAIASQRPRDTNLQVAVSDRRGRATFYCVTSGSGFSTLSPAIAAGWRTRGQTVQEIEVPVVTLAELCAGADVRDVDFLKVDVEGAEREVIAGGDWARVRPRVVIVEATQPGSPEPAWHEWEPLLVAHRYTFGLFDGLNRYYVRSEDEGLLEAFRLPPNVFDGFTPYALARARADAASGAQRAEAWSEQVADLRARLHYLEDGVTFSYASLLGQHAYAWGDVVSFARGGNSARHMLDGWYPPEECGTWTRGQESGLLFEAGPPPGDLVLAMDVAPFVVGERVPGQRLEVWVNGLRVGATTVTAPGAVRVVIPAQVWTARQVAEVRLLHPDAQCPAALGVSQDARTLGFAVRRMTIARDTRRSHRRAGEEAPWVTSERS